MLIWLLLTLLGDMHNLTSAEKERLDSFLIANHSAGAVRHIMGIYDMGNIHTEYLDEHINLDRSMLRELRLEDNTVRRQTRESMVWMKRILNPRDPLFDEVYKIEFRCFSERIEGRLPKEQLLAICRMSFQLDLLSSLRRTTWQRDLQLTEEQVRAINLLGVGQGDKRLKRLKLELAHSDIACFLLLTDEQRTNVLYLSGPPIKGGWIEEFKRREVEIKKYEEQIAREDEAAKQKNQPEEKRE